MGDTAPAPPVPDDDAPPDDGYAVAPPVALATLAQRDTGDAALERYKAALGVSVGAAAAAASDAEARHVVIHELRVCVEGRPDLVLPLATPAAVAATAATRLRVKEGATYALRVTFTVHREIVLGLRFSNRVYRMGVPVDSDVVAIGAYAPRPEPYSFDLLSGAEWPSGMLARGAYTARSRFTDADGATHLELSWSFDIAKAWPADAPP